jgi:hypothetical protein
VIDAPNRLSIGGTSSCSSTQGVGSHRQPTADLWQGAQVLMCNCFAPLWFSCSHFTPTPPPRTCDTSLSSLYFYEHTLYPTNNSHDHTSDVRQLGRPAKWSLQFVQQDAFRISVLQKPGWRIPELLRWPRSIEQDIASPRLRDCNQEKERPRAGLWRPTERWRNFIHQARAMDPRRASFYATTPRQ